MQNTPRQTTFMMDVLDIASALIEKPSITPEDAGCQIWLAEALQHLDFQCQTLPFGNVSNLWATLGQ